MKLRSRCLAFSVAAAILLPSALPASGLALGTQGAQGAQGAQDPAPQTAPATQAKNITNSFADSDLKQALGDVATQAGVVIVPDETVQGTVTVKLENTPLERALDIMLAPGNFSWAKMDGYYLVGKAEPNSPNFLRFSKTVTVKPSHLPAETVAALLPPAIAPYVKATAGSPYLTVTAAPQLLQRIQDDIKEIDRPGRRIMLEALVTEVTTETLNQYNFSWLWKHFGGSTAPDESGFSYDRASVTDVATLKALIGKNLAEVRANPRIMAIEGKEASVEVAKENYFEVTTGPANFAYTSLQVIKTGISLKMTPSISDDGEVTVQLSPEVSDVAGQGKGGLPINTVRRASTTVRVRDGETIVIGGMTYANNRSRTSKIPVIGDLPVLGQFFRSRERGVVKTEVIIMITPRIVR